jgi:2-polyprenyl-3-methyl-5-hydroxy-6-metoxy-1,4-benzoquinol methylase
VSVQDVAHDVNDTSQEFSMSSDPGVQPMDILAIQKDYYDRRWAREKFANTLQGSRCSAILGEIARLDINQPRILDLGCGSGWLTAILGQFGPTTGVDLSDHAVREACKLYPWVRFYSANILEWDEASQLEKFDIVVSQEVIEHVSDKPKYLRIAFDFLKDGGTLLLTTPNAHTFAAMQEQVRRSWSDQPFEELLTPRQLKQMVCSHFNIVDARTIIPAGSKGLYRIVNSYKLGKILERLGLNRAFEAACLRAGFGLHTIVVARKPAPR